MSMRVDAGNQAPRVEQSNSEPADKAEKTESGQNDQAAQEAQRAAEEAQRAAEEARRAAEEARRAAEGAERQAREAAEAALEAQARGRLDPKKEQAAKLADVKAQEAARRATVAELQAQKAEAALKAQGAETGKPLTEALGRFVKDGLEQVQPMVRAGEGVLEKLLGADKLFAKLVGQPGTGAPLQALKVQDGKGLWSLGEQLLHSVRAAVEPPALAQARKAGTPEALGNILGAAVQTLGSDAPKALLDGAFAQRVAQGETPAEAAAGLGVGELAGAAVNAVARSVLPSRNPTLEEAAQEIADKTRIREPARMDLTLAAQLGGMRGAGPFQGASVDGLPVFFKNYTVPGGNPTRPDAQVYTTLQRNAEGQDEWRTFEVAGNFAHAYNEMFPGRAGTNSPLGLPESGRSVMEDGPYAGKSMQHFQNGTLVEVEPGVIQRLDKQGEPVGDPWKDPKPVDLAKDVPLPKPGQDVSTVGGVGPTGANRVSGPDLTAEDVRRIIGNAEKARGADFSPLNDGDMPEYLVAVSKETGVPVWLLLAQAQNETSFGSGTRDGYRPPPQINNATVSDGQQLLDPRGRAAGVGNPHNLFNIRPGSEWKGKHINLDGSGDFRAYDAFKDSVRDYANLMATAYKGLNVTELVNKYYPAGDGDNKPETYINNILGFAHANGINVSRSSVPIGPQAQETNITQAAPQSGAEGVGAAQGVPGAGYEIPGAEDAIRFAQNPPIANPDPESGGSWHYYCLGMVNNAYKSAGRPIDNLAKPTAYQSYLAYKNQGQIRQDWPPPRGAIVFYDWHNKGENIGHIGISLGNGKHVNTATSGAPTQVTDIRTPSYLGWAYPTAADAKAADAAAARQASQSSSGNSSARSSTDGLDTDTGGIKAQTLGFQRNVQSSSGSGTEVGGIDPSALSEARIHEEVKKAASERIRGQQGVGTYQQAMNVLTSNPYPQGSEKARQYNAEVIFQLKARPSGSPLQDRQGLRILTGGEYASSNFTEVGRQIIRDAIKDAFNLGTLQTQEIRERSRTSKAYADVAQEIGLDIAGPSAEATGSFKLMSQFLADFKDARAKVLERDADLAKLLGAALPYMSDAQKEKAINNYKAHPEFAPAYARQQESLELMGQLVADNMHVLKEMAIRGSPAEQQQVFDMLKAAAQSPQADRVAQGMVSEPNILDANTPLGFVMASRFNASKKLVPLALGGAASALLAKGSSPESVVNFWESIGKSIVTTADGKNNVKSVLLDGYDSLKSLSDMSEIRDALKVGLTGASSFERLRGLAEDVGFKGTLKYGLGLFLSVAVTGEKLGEQKLGDAIKELAAIGHDTGEFVSSLSASATKDQLFVKGGSAARFAAGAGLLASGISLYSHTQDLIANPNAGRAVATAGDVLSAVGSGIQLLFPKAHPLIGAVAWGVGQALTAIGDLWDKGIEADQLKKDAQSFLRGAALNDVAALLDVDKERLEKLKGLVQDGESVQQMVKRFPSLVNKSLVSNESLDRLDSFRKAAGLAPGALPLFLSSLNPNGTPDAKDRYALNFLRQAVGYYYDKANPKPVTREQWANFLEARIKSVSSTVDKDILRQALSYVKDAPRPQPVGNPRNGPVISPD